jgi:hypothetical protein
MSEDLGTFACPHCGVDNRVGELYCARCGRRLPRSSAELREKMMIRLAEERQRADRRHLVISAAIGIAMAVAIRLLAETAPQDIVGMAFVVEMARYFFWLAGIIWGGIFWLAFRSGRV